METPRIMEGQTWADNSSLPPARDERALPQCAVCGWKPYMGSPARSLAKLRQAVDKHFKRNHTTRDYRCPVCHQTFRNRLDNVKPHVKRMHPQIFSQLYPQEELPLSVRNKALPPDSILVKTKRPESRVEHIWGDGSLAGRAVPEPPAQESLSLKIRRSPVPHMPPSYDSTSSKRDSGYESMVLGDDMPLANLPPILEPCTLADDLSEY